MSTIRFNNANTFISVQTKLVYATFYAVPEFVSKALSVGVIQQTSSSPFPSAALEVATICLQGARLSNDATLIIDVENMFRSIPLPNYFAHEASKFAKHGFYRTQYSGPIEVRLTKPDIAKIKQYVIDGTLSTALQIISNYLSQNGMIRDQLSENILSEAKHIQITSYFTKGNTVNNDIQPFDEDAITFGDYTVDKVKVRGELKETIVADYYGIDTNFDPHKNCDMWFNHSKTEESQVEINHSNHLTMQYCIIASNKLVANDLARMLCIKSICQSNKGIRDSYFLTAAKELYMTIEQPQTKPFEMKPRRREDFPREEVQQSGYLPKDSDANRNNQQNFRQVTQVDTPSSPTRSQSLRGLKQGPQIPRQSGNQRRGQSQLRQAFTNDEVYALRKFISVYGLNLR